MKRHYQLFLMPPSYRKGITLIELTVALVLTSIITGIIYMTWNHITLHTEVQKKRASLHGECIRISQQINQQLHTAASIIKWDPHSITFTTANKSDTLAYSFDGTTLTCNNIPVILTVPQSTVRNFSLENENTDDGIQPYLFTCTLILGNAIGDTVATQTAVLIHRTTINDPSGDNFTW
jgi:prepilin-type N-terminal cleavage/methylation domain-containing protein